MGNTAYIPCYLDVKEKTPNKADEGQKYIQFIAAKAY